MTMDPNSSTAKAVDVIAASSLIGSILGWLPAVASVISILWFCIQIYESRTFTQFKNDYLMRRKAKKLAKLRAQERALVAQITAIETATSIKSPKNGDV